MAWRITLDFADFGDDAGFDDFEDELNLILKGFEVDAGF